MIGMANEVTADELLAGLKAKGWNPAAIVAHDFELDSVMLSMGWAPPASDPAAYFRLAGDRKATAQRFFAQMAAESRKPHFGEMQAGWMRSLLIRAEEAGLFDPKEHA